MFGFAFADVLEITDASGATTKVGVRAVDLADSAESRRELLGEARGNGAERVISRVLTSLHVCCSSSPGTNLPSITLETCRGCVCPHMQCLVVFFWTQARTHARIDPQPHAGLCASVSCMCAIFSASTWSPQPLSCEQKTGHDSYEQFIQQPDNLFASNAPRTPNNR